MRILRPLFFAAISLLVLPVMAQKFGHLNSATIIESHPGVVTANTALETFRKSVTDPFEAKTKSFQSKYQFFQAEVDAGTISQVTAKTRQAELAKEQEDLKTEGQQIQYAIYQKREELLRPILAEVDSIIQMVAREGKYTMVFDDSVTGALLYAVGNEDLTQAVMARLKKDE